MRHAARAAVVLLALVLAGCGEATDEAPVVEARRAPFEKTLTIVGRLAAKRTLNLPSPTEGKLSFVVSEGSRVKAGDVVFSLETKEIEERLDAARIDLTVSESSLRKAEEEIRTERVKNELSLRETTAQLEHAELELRRAEEELAKKRRQVENKILPAAEIPGAELQVEQARLSLENARIALERMTEEQKSRKETLELDRQAAAARLEKSQAQVTEAEEFLSKATVTAPRDGVVVHARSWRGQDWKAGDEVWQKQPVVELPELEVMEVQLEIHEADISEVKEGTPARIRLEAWPDLRLLGSVEEVSGVAKELRDRDGKGTGVRAFEAVVGLAERDDRLRPGLTARVELVLDVRPDALVVPLAAVQRDGTRASVVMASGEIRDVEVAASSADVAVIAKGLEAGDRVRIVPRQREASGEGNGATAPAAAPEPAPPAADRAGTVVLPPAGG